MDYMRRVEILDLNQLLVTTFYVHKNAVHHGLCKVIQEWKWSCFHTFLSEKPTSLKREIVLDWFGGKKEFLEFHEQAIILKKIEPLKYL
jgi:hypothetical protein